MQFSRGPRLVLLLQGALAACSLGASACRGAPSGPPAVVAFEAEAASAEAATPADAGSARPTTVDAADLTALRQALKTANLDAVRRLLDAGVDPNAMQPDGTPVVRWLAASPRVKDDDALAVATLLAGHRCSFEDRGAGRVPGVLVNLAHRHLHKTLQFIASRAGPQDCTHALKSVAWSDDLDAVKILLANGADPLWGLGGLQSSLLDAASNGRASSVAELLRHVSNVQDPKVVAAYRTVRAADAATRKVFVDAGLEPPPPQRPPTPMPRALPPDVAQIMARLGLTGPGASECHVQTQCGDVVLVDCNSAADGPAYYIDKVTPKVLATCGGACMRGCTNCPPREWTCGRSPP